MADIFEEEYEDEPNEQNIVQEEAEQPVMETRIPDKYRGKSIEDIIAMHQESEKLIGRQGQEIGEVRKLADQLIQSTFKPKAEAPKEEESEEIDFFVDPKKAVERVINSHPKLKQAEEKAAEYEKMVNLQRVEKSHPDMYDIVQDPDFVDWVKRSKIRTELYMKADRNFDYDSADELLSTFKELKGRRQSTQATEEIQEIRDSADRSLRKAVVSAGSSQEAPKKIFRRADLMKLLSTDPDRYDSMQDEIMQAYSDGRVR